MRTLILLIPLLAGTIGYSSFSQPQGIASLSPSEYSGEIIDVDGTLYFSGSYSLFRVVDEMEWLASPSDKPVHLKNVNGVLYFTLYEYRNDQASVWKSDGTSGGTKPFKIFHNTLSHVSPLTNIGSDVYFGFRDQLYKSDGTDSGTVLVKDLDGADSTGFLRLSALDDKVFISFTSDASQYELWVSDGTTSGTSFIRSFQYLEWLPAAGNNLYFIGDDGITGNELWKLGNDGSASLVRDFNPGGGSFWPGKTLAREWKGELIFTTGEPSATWKTSGTAVTTVQIAPFAPVELAVTPAMIFLSRYDELWKSDGHSATLLRSFSDATGDKPLANLTAHDNTLFFTLNGTQLWQTDGTDPGTILISDSETRGATSRLISAGPFLYRFISFVVEAGNDYEASLEKYDPASVWIPGFYLVDATTDEDIGLIRDNDVISVDHDISVRAEASLATASVRFSINGVSYRRETQRPFARRRYQGRL